MDVCILDDIDIRLLVQEGIGYPYHPEPQLIAKAISACHDNDPNRTRALSWPPLNSQVVPGIAVKGTAPTFYTAMMTAEGRPVCTQTRLPSPRFCPYSSPTRRFNEKMKLLDYRRLMLCCYETFQTFIRCIYE
jgi:hypothetical protein